MIIYENRAAHTANYRWPLAQRVDTPQAFLAAVCINIL